MVNVNFDERIVLNQLLIKTGDNSFIQIHGSSSLETFVEVPTLIFKSKPHLESKQINNLLQEFKSVGDSFEERFHRIDVYHLVEETTLEFVSHRQFEVICTEIVTADYSNIKSADGKQTCGI